MINYSLLQQRYVINTYPNRQLCLIKGDGVYLYDELGTEYLDCMTNYGVNMFGYNNKSINNAIIEQLGKLTDLHCSFNNDVRAKASQQLVKRCGDSYYQVYWSNSGAEAIEAALKFAVATTNKHKFIVCNHAYHGKTLGALSATDGQKYRQPFFPLLWDFSRIEFNNLEVLENAIDDKTAAFIVEPIQGEGGILPPSKNYLKKVQEICAKHNILLILDEIQAGTGRTGYFLASHEEKVTADIVCLGKGLGGGLPVGATVVNENIAKKIAKNLHTSTFGGNPLTCAAAIQVLDLLNDEMLSHITAMGSYLISSLKKINSPLIQEVRGKGLMIGVAVKDKRNEILKLMQDEKVLVIPAGDNVVRFLPPYIIQKKDVDKAVKAFEHVLASL